MPTIGGRKKSDVQPWFRKKCVEQIGGLAAAIEGMTQVMQRADAGGGIPKVSGKYVVRMSFLAKYAQWADSGHLLFVHPSDTSKICWSKDRDTAGPGDSSPPGSRRRRCRSASADP